MMTSSCRVFLLAAVLLGAAPHVLHAQQPTGTLRGVVRDADTGAPLGNVTVRVTGTALQTLSAANGAFGLSQLAAGTHTVEAELIGYALTRVSAVQVSAQETTTLEFRLTRQVIPLADVVVTPGHFGIAHERLSKPQTLTRAMIETLPQLADDLFRTVNRLPGMASHEFSARFTVRGGDDESVLVLLDGVELFEPYHLKDFDGSLSVLDVAAIGGVDLTTGGFSAAYGNHLTGVFDVRTSNLIAPRPRTQLGLSLNNVRALSQGSFADGNGLWLASVRRGYLDIVLKLAQQDADMDPRYYDALGKVVYQISPRHRISAHVLRAADALTLRDDDGNGLLTSKYGSSYGWLSWQAQLSERVSVETLVSSGLLDWRRDAAENEVNSENFEIRDVRDLTFAALRQDWQLSVHERVLLRAGLDTRFSHATYDYFKMKRERSVENGSLQARFDTTRVDSAPEGTELGAYVLQRVRPWQPLTVEAGLRWDRQTITDEMQWSPRLNAAVALGERTTLRLGWGQYAQPHRLHQLSVQDGAAEFGRAERADQLVAGMERDVGAGVRLRAEAYRRTESNLRPRYLNLAFQIEPVAEVEGDRFRADRTSGRAEGIELFAQQHRASSNWSVSYALARAEDMIEGRSTPRPLEQRHTVYLDHSFVPKTRWRVSWSWQYHSGWPATETHFAVDTITGGGVFFRRTFGEYHSERLPAYHRMDMRVSRDIALRRGRLNVFLDVFNVYNRANAQAYEYNVNFRAGRLTVQRSYEPMLPRMPSIGVTWEF